MSGWKKSSRFQLRAAGIALFVVGFVLTAAGYWLEDYWESVAVSLGTGFLAAAVPYIIIIESVEREWIHVGPRPPKDPETPLWIDTSEP